MSYIKYIFLLVLFLTGGLTSSFAQLNEGFEGAFPPPGWAIFDNGVETADSWKQLTINPNTGDKYAYVRFTNNPAVLAEDWLVTPKLLPTDGDHTLTFYATDDSPSDYGSIYTVRVSTTSQSDLGSFTTVSAYLESDFTNDVYQQFTVDLSAFNGEEIYVAFVLENSNGDSFLLDDVTGPAVAPALSAPNCDALLVTPADAATDVAIGSNLTWSPATGDPAGYQVRIGTTSGGDEFLVATDAGSNLFYKPTTNFEYSTTYYVTILPYNDFNNANPTTCSEFSFTTAADPSIVLDCAGAATPVNRSLCYGNDEIHEFTISGGGTGQVQLTFNSGVLEFNFDEIFIYDGTDDTGVLLNANQLSGDMAGRSYVSYSNSLFVRLDTDINRSCADGEQIALDFTASCISCVPPAGTAAVSTNCNAEMGWFYIDVNISDLGSGDVIVSNDQHLGTYTLSTDGVTETGPYNFGTVTLTLTNTDDANCAITLPPITQNNCTPVNDACGSPIPLHLSTNNCNNGLTGTTIGANPIQVTTDCPSISPSVWYNFTPATTDDYLFEFFNTPTPISLIVYEGNCATGLTSLSECAQATSVKTTVQLTENVTYLVEVRSDIFGGDSDFTLCVSVAPDVPLNDLCSGATVIGNTNDSQLIGEDATFATTTDVAACNNNPMGKGIWYLIEGNGDILSFTVTPNNWDCEIQAWSGSDCQNLTCLMQQDAGTTGAMESIANLTTEVGTMYYFYVGAFGLNQPTGTFDVATAFTTVLSVELTKFTGEATGATNTLSWTTNSENNLAKFVIERSSDNDKDWTAIGVVSPRNQPNQTYEWKDEQPLALAYYRLRSVEQNGAFDLSEVIVIEQSKENEIKVFPIPTKGKVTVQYEMVEAGRVTLTLTDVLGRQVYQREVEVTFGQNMSDIELGEFDNGIYQLTIDNGLRRRIVRLLKH